MSNKISFKQYWVKNWASKIPFTMTVFLGAPFVAANNPERLPKVLLFQAIAFVVLNLAIALLASYLWRKDYR